MARKSGLGKGLDALFLDNNTDKTEVVQLSMDVVTPNKDQPRKHFDDEALTALADSIREHGVIQPIIVRPLPNGNYEIIAGERRWRACKMIGIKQVPAMVRELADRETMEIALIENLQREDLNPIEESKGYQELMETYQMTQEEVSKRVGKSRSTVANALRLLNMPASIVLLVQSGDLSVGQAKAIMAFSSPEEMKEMAEMAAKKGTTVRELERLASKQKKKKNPQTSFAHDFYQELAISMQEEMHRKVKITQDKDGKGTLQIAFYSKDELMDMAYRLANKGDK